MDRRKLTDEDVDWIRTIWAGDTTQTGRNVWETFGKSRIGIRTVQLIVRELRDEAGDRALPPSEDWLP